MNRLILIGNGFDLAHGIKTGYNDFIVWYITNCFSKAINDGHCDDDLLTIHANTYFYIDQELTGKTIQEYILEHYKNGTLNSLMGVKHNYIPEMIFSSDFTPDLDRWTSAFKVQIKSELLIQMINDCTIDKWVDIENLFYSSLKKALVVDNRNKADDVQELNRSITFIIEELRVYLMNFGHCKEKIDKYRILMKEAIRPSEIVERPPLTPNDLHSTVPNNTLILNFNYTNTVEQYLLDNDNHIKVNYIHGKLDEPENPMIFGFGDELDAEYSKFELDTTKELFKYIKSFWYFKTSNYHDLLRFIQTDKFQVYILGHSCGLSDRTMLNMIFEHDNCISIKIHYYKNLQTSNNNYTELTEEISRHFKDKRQMRLKIVPFDKSCEMPQILPF